MELKGKQLTLAAKIAGAVIALLGLAAKVLVAPDLDIDAVLKVAGFTVIVFAPIDLSLVAQNIFSARTKPLQEVSIDAYKTGELLGKP